MGPIYEAVIWILLYHSLVAHGEFMCWLALCMKSIYQTGTDLCLWSCSFLGPHLIVTDYRRPTTPHKSCTFKYNLTWFLAFTIWAFLGSTLMINCSHLCKCNPSINRCCDNESLISYSLYRSDAACNNFYIIK